MSDLLRWLRTFAGELRMRGVHRAAAAYGAAVFVLLQATDLLLKAVPMPEPTFRVIAMACFIGFPVMLVLAWAFDFTGGRLTRTPSTASGASSSEPARFRMLSLLVLVGVVIAVAGIFTVRSLQLRVPRDEHVVAVFPFRTSGLDVAHWAEGVPDLLSTVLDGTAGLIVADPWSLWTSLRAGPHEIAASPDPERATQLARRSRAHRFLLGSIVDSGDSVNVNVRVYDARTGRPLRSLTAVGVPTQLRDIVRDLAVQFIAAAATEQEMPALGRIDADLTGSPEALKAYMLARLSMRRGLVDSADVAIDEALAHDSLFAAAIVEATVIKSWAQYMRGEPFAGLLELVQRGLALDSLLRERDRLRLAAAEASIRTDGAAAAAALRSILAQDSTDLHAWSTLLYVSTAYGWQYGSSESVAVDISDRTLRLDSAYVPLLAARVWQAVSSNDAAQYDRLVRLLSVDSSSALARSRLSCLRSITVSDSAFDAIAAAAARDRFHALGMLRCLRVVRPDRSSALVEGWRSSVDPWLAEFATAEQARMAITRGRTEAVAARIGAGDFNPVLSMYLQLLIAAASLASVGDHAAAALAIEDLGRRVPIDSAAAYFEKEPVWWIGWMLGAHAAQYGDTVVAARWQQAIGRMPAGGSPVEYRAALIADIEARLDVRRGDAESALVNARRAFSLWDIHTENQYESMPEPHMRLHLAMLQKNAGQPDSAHALLRSLVPPTAWLGFLSARAAFELGTLEEQNGAPASAERFYMLAWTLWSYGDAEIEPWREQARQGLERVRGAHM